MAETVVIGLDPGLTATGFAIVKNNNNEFSLLKSGTLRPKRDLKLWDKLFYIYNELTTLLREFSPTEAAIEDVFVSKNAKSALKLGHVRGVAMLACNLFNLKIFQYEPSVIKKSLTGKGTATKKQVKYMVNKLLKLDGNLSFDASDAIAVAICHLTQRAFYDRIS